MSLPSVAPPTPQTPEPTPRHPNPNTPLPLDHIPHLDLSMSPNTFKQYWSKNFLAFLEF